MWNWLENAWIALDAAEQFSVLGDFSGLVLTLAALVFAGYQFRRGVIQYKHEQTWRRKEYVAKEYDRLIADPDAGLALLMLDWTSRSFPLLKGKDDSPIMVTVDRKLLGRSLIPHTIRERPPWGEVEAVIRDKFDILLERLSTLEIMITERLLREDDVKPYLAYWIELIGARPEPGSEDSHLREIRNLWLYIDCYKFARVVKFAGRFGFHISPRETDLSDLEAECRNKEWHN